MHQTHAIPNIIWIMLCWQVAMLAIAFTVWLLTRPSRRDQRAAQDLPPTPPPAPAVEHDAPGLRTIASFEALLYSEELDAEVWDHDAMLEDLMERLGNGLMAEDMDVEESYAEDDYAELSLCFVYRDARYNVVVNVDELGGQLWLNQLRDDGLHYAPDDTFATRELLTELHRFLRHAPVSDVRWHARQNVHAQNMDAWANTPF